MTLPSEYKALKQLILSSFDAYESALAQDGHEEPQMVKPELSTLDDPNRIPSWELVRSRDVLRASLRQMGHLVGEPGERLACLGVVHLTSAALSVAVESKVPNALLDAPAGGMPIAELAKKINVAPLQLTIALRMLANDNIFTEVSQDHWANNRTSLMMIDSTHLWHYVRHQTWFSLRHSVHIADVWRDPTLSVSTKPTDAAAGVAFELTKHGHATIFDMLKAAPDGRLESFGRAMGATAQFSVPGVLVDYPWKERLPAAAIICDVGGGEGHVLLQILRLEDSWKGMIQDRPEVLPHAKGNVEKNFAQGVDRVDYVPIDFLSELRSLSPHGERDPDAPFCVTRRGCPCQRCRRLSHALHLARLAGCGMVRDKQHPSRCHRLHSFPHSITILKNIRKAMKPDSKIIIL